MVGLRVAFQQPGLPWYRVGLYERLGDRIGEPVTVYHDTAAPNAPLADLDGRALRAVAVRDAHLAGGRLVWSATQVRLAGSRAFDCAVLSWNARYLSLPVALFLARMRRQPVLVWGHGHAKTDGRVRRAYRLLVGLLASGILLYEARGMRSVPCRLRDRVHIVGNAVFRDTPVRAAAGGQDPSHHDLHLVHLGRLRPDRRLELAVEAVAELAAAGHDAWLTLAGDGEHRMMLEALAKERGVRDRVCFAGPVYDDEAVRQLLASADAAVYGCAGGLGVLDCLEAELPVILCGPLEQQPPEATIVYERFPELIDPSSSGAGIASVVQRLRSVAGLRDRLAEAASDLATARDQMVDALTAAVTAHAGGDRGGSSRHR